MTLGARRLLNTRLLQSCQCTAEIKLPFLNLALCELTKALKACCLTSRELGICLENVLTWPVTAVVHSNWYIQCNMDKCSSIVRISLSCLTHNPNDTQKYSNFSSIRLIEVFHCLYTHFAKFNSFFTVHIHKTVEYTGLPLTETSPFDAFLPSCTLFN